MVGPIVDLAVVSTLPAGVGVIDDEAASRPRQCPWLIERDALACLGQVVAEASRLEPIVGLQEHEISFFDGAPDRLEAKKVALRVLAMSGAQTLDTSTAIGKLMLSVIGAVGQFEREMMLERQKDGIAKAQREGRYKGRVPTARRQAAEIVRLRDAGVKPAEIAVRLGIGRASVYRVLGGQTAEGRQEAA